MLTERHLQLSSPLIRELHFGEIAASLYGDYRHQHGVLNTRAMLLCLPEHDERGIFSDIHAERHALCDGRQLVIIPDIIADFRRLPFEASSFSVVVFDPTS